MPLTAGPPDQVARRVDLSARQLTSLTWEFPGSEFAGLTYADCDAYDAVPRHVLANAGPAVRAGVLASAR